MHYITCEAGFIEFCTHFEVNVVNFFSRKEMESLVSRVKDKTVAQN